MSTLNRIPVKTNAYRLHTELMGTNVRVMKLKKEKKKKTKYREIDQFTFT